jgi:hypothetical protein
MGTISRKRSRDFWDYEGVFGEVGYYPFSNVRQGKWEAIKEENISKDTPRLKKPELFFAIFID